MSALYTAVAVRSSTDLLQLAETPRDALRASALLSRLSGRMLKELSARGASPRAILFPWIQCIDGEPVLSDSPDSEIECLRRRGVPLWPGRILLQRDFAGAAAEARTCTLDALADILTESTGGDRSSIRTFLAEELCLEAVCMEAPQRSSPAAYMDRCLAALLREETTAPAELNSPLAALVEGRTKAASLLLPEDTDVPPTLQALARGSSPAGWTSEEYYAVLCAASDTMDRLLAGMLKPDRIRHLARMRQTAFASAASCVLDYGGVCIRSSGEGLLALLPLTGQDPYTGAPCTLYRLCDRIREQFNGVFGDMRVSRNGIPSVSFGISVSHYTLPLREGLRRAEEMLRTAAGSAANFCCTGFQRRGCQFVTMLDSYMDWRQNQSGKCLCTLMDELFLESREDEAPEFLVRVRHTLERSRALFVTALQNRDQGLQHAGSLFVNLFSEEDHARYGDYLEKLWQFLAAAADGMEPEGAEHVMDQLLGAVCMLQLMKDRGPEERG